MSTFIRCSDSGSQVFLKEGILLTRYESVGRVFESPWAHQKFQRLGSIGQVFFRCLQKSPFPPRLHLRFFPPGVKVRHVGGHFHGELRLPFLQKAFNALP